LKFIKVEIKTEKICKQIMFRFLKDYNMYFGICEGQWNIYEVEINGAQYRWLQKIRELLETSGFHFL
jgi:hypothetical protein